MLNAIWIFMVATAIAVGAINGRLAEVGKASTESAGAAVTLAIGLVGVMSFWLGLMRVLQEAGVLRVIARGLRPVMVRLFPEVPAEHPAMGMMIMNMTSNILGLGNAATPFGLKAMSELDSLNPHKGTASNSMALFLAINTSGLAVLPTGVIALRASLGSTSPGSIFVPTLLATMTSTFVAVVVAKALQGLPAFAMPLAPSPELAASATKEIDTAAAEALVAAGPGPVSRTTRWVGRALLVGLAAVFVWALTSRAMSLDGAGMPVGWLTASREALSDWTLVLLIGLFVALGVLRGAKVYDAVVEGGKEGFQTALRIIPFLVAILVAVGMLRAAGAIDSMVRVLEPLTSLVGMPGEALPMALLRPLTGSGAFAVAADVMKEHGPDSLVGQIVSTMQGSTETTFYVLALYFGAVSVRAGRHTLAACLAADVAGLLAATWLCRWFFA